MIKRVKNPEKEYREAQEHLKKMDELMKNNKQIEDSLNKTQDYYFQDYNYGCGCCHCHCHNDFVPPWHPSKRVWC